MKLNPEELKEIVDFISPDFDDNENLSWKFELVQRRKENPEVKCNFRILKTRYVNTFEEMIDFINHSINKYDLLNEMIDVYNFHNDVYKHNVNTRIYMSAKPFNHTKAKATFITTIGECMYSGAHINKNIYHDVVSKKACADGKSIWMIDYDEPALISLDEIRENISKFTDIICEYPTKNGTHIVLKPFNLKLIKSSEIGWNINFVEPTEKDKKKALKGAYKITNINNEELFTLMLSPSFLVQY